MEPAERYREGQAVRQIVQRLAHEAPGGLGNAVDGRPGWNVSASAGSCSPLVMTNDLPAPMALWARRMVAWAAAQNGIRAPETVVSFEIERNDLHSCRGEAYDYTCNSSPYCSRFWVKIYVPDDWAETAYPFVSNPYDLEAELAPWVNCVEEELTLVLAHEFRHVEQAKYGFSQWGSDESERDAEIYGIEVLCLLRQDGCHGAFSKGRPTRPKAHVPVWPATTIQYQAKPSHEVEARP